MNNVQLKFHRPIVPSYCRLCITLHFELVIFQWPHINLNTLLVSARKSFSLDSFPAPFWCKAGSCWTSAAESLGAHQLMLVRV